MHFCMYVRMNVHMYALHMPACMDGCTYTCAIVAKHVGMHVCKYAGLSCMYMCVYEREYICVSYICLGTANISTKDAFGGMEKPVRAVRWAARFKKVIMDGQPWVRGKHDALS